MIDGMGFCGQQERRQRQQDVLSPIGKHWVAGGHPGASVVRVSTFGGRTLVVLVCVLVWCVARPSAFSTGAPVRHKAEAQRINASLYRGLRCAKKGHELCGSTSSSATKDTPTAHQRTQCRTALSRLRCLWNLLEGLEYKGDEQAGWARDLAKAIQTDDLAEMRRLIETAGDVDARDPRTGRTMLIRAADWQAREAIEMLLMAGAEVNARDDTGSNALSLAVAGPVFGGRADETLVRLLLNAGADANAEDDAGDSPLMVAAYNGQRDVCAMLIDAGADVQHKNYKGEDCKQAARNGGHDWDDFGLLY